MPYFLRTKADQNSLILSIHETALTFARGAVDRADVQDVASDVVLYCTDKLRSGAWKRLPKNLQALVRRIVKARVTDVGRKATSDQENEFESLALSDPSDSEWMPADCTWSEASIQEYLAETMKKLPPRCRQAYSLVRLMGYTYEEAAGAMRVTTRTICNQIVRAHRTFREELLLDGVESLPKGSGEKAAERSRLPIDRHFAPDYVTEVPARAIERKTGPNQLPICSGELTIGSRLRPIDADELTTDTGNRPVEAEQRPTGRLLVPTGSDQE